MTEFKKLMIIR